MSISTPRSTRLFVGAAHLDLQREYFAGLELLHPAGVEVVVSTVEGVKAGDGSQNAERDGFAEWVTVERAPDG